MIKIGGQHYFINFDAIETVVAGKEDFKEREITETEKKTFTNEEGKVYNIEESSRTYIRDKQYDASKYEILLMMIQVVMQNQDEIDDMMGIEATLAKLPIPFKIAFNTLLYYQVIKKLDI